MSTFLHQGSGGLGQAEEGAGVGGGLLGHLCEGDAFDVGDALGDEGDVGGFVALAAVGHGTEVRGIGLEQQVFEGDGADDVGEGGVFEGDHAADAEVEAHFDGTPGFLHAAAEAVHYAAVAGTTQVAQQGEDLVVSLTDMEAYGQVELFGPEQLGFQHFALLSLVGAVPIKVHADFAYGDKGSRVRLTEGCAEEAVVDVLQFGFEIVFDGGGVQAGHGINRERRMRRGERVDEGIESGGGGAVDVGQQKGGDTRVDGALQGLVAVGVESLVVDVAVGVYELKIEN